MSSPMISFNRSSSNPNKMERKFYHTWVAIIYRCSGTNKNSARYFDRGIKVSPRWKNFDYFFIDMWDAYIIHYGVFGINTEIDRIDNDKGYYKLNCRWVTRKENTNNRENAHLFNGKTLAQWAPILGIKRSTLAQRFYVYGWSIDRTLLT